MVGRSAAGVQTTLRSKVTIRGIGLHTGQPARVTIHPSPAEFGIWFRRTDVRGRDNLIAARYDCVTDSELCTALGNDDGVQVMTVEHLMAALYGTGVHNALIEIDGPEVPILDGSAAPFVRAILERGLVPLDAPVRVLRILEPVSVRNGAAEAALVPAETLEIDFAISFPDPAIGDQHSHLVLANGSFVHELSDCRTFCRWADVEAMRARGLGRGGSLDNAVVVDGDRVLNPGGLRREREMVRHKMLDALGDLALAGAPIIGRYVGRRAGHALTNRLLRKLFATPGAFRMDEASPEEAAQLPGAGVGPADLEALAG
ncbi:MAG: UDP-3-O-acyl-N-acetylglucosamine deacetylase [Alphaproteobacteria bacterium]|nr:MAG: UDP-3-O-acyl-N-acetylglucosamine deacetylase [Alphaproteobacteria bacterium]